MRVEVYQQAGFWSVRASEPIRAGEVVLSLSTSVVRDAPSRSSIRIGEGQHAEDTVGAFVNHSCSPSCRVDGPRILAIRDLPPGAEITFDYTENEGPLASPFTCLDCGELLSGAPPPCLS